MDLTKENPSRKLLRYERKKKKLMAYLEIASLNAQDEETGGKRVLEEEDEKRKVMDAEAPPRKCLKTEGDQAATVSCRDANNKDRNSDDVILKRRASQLKKRKCLPEFILKKPGHKASLSNPLIPRVPLFMSDIKHLLTYVLLEKQAPFLPPRWYSLNTSGLTHTIVLVVENFSMYDFVSKSSKFDVLEHNFQHKVEVITPALYKCSLVEELISVPLTEVHKQKLITKYGTLEAGLLKDQNVCKELSSTFPIASEEKCDVPLPPTDTFSRTHLLLSASQLIEEQYPVPLQGELKDKYRDYVMTNDNYQEVTPKSPMFSLDCEMCRTTTGKLEVTRISIVDENSKVIYHSFVKPHNRITDYLTKFSGVTKELLEGVTVRLEDVQRKLRELLPPDAILVGQSLQFDLHSLKMMHPFIIDTSVIYNLTGSRSHKSKLRVIAQKYLHEDIQRDAAGHNPVEDSICCMKLTQLKLSKGIDFGDSVMFVEKQNNKNWSSIGNQNLLQHIKEGSVVAVPDVMEEYNKYMSKATASEAKSEKCLRCYAKDSNNDVIECVKNTALENQFLLAHIKYPQEDMDEEVCEQISDFCGSVWKSVAVNGMCVILLGGRKKANGACFIQIKKLLH